LLERAGGGIARVGEWRFARLFAFAVELLKRRAGKKYFAAYFETLRRWPCARA
jgi:hypothetical protein